MLRARSHRKPALLGAHIYRMVIDACIPMARPIRVFVVVPPVFKRPAELRALAAERLARVFEAQGYTA